jgi:predicted ATPase
VRGYPDQAWHQQQEALRLAQELAHPLALICTLAWGAWLHQFRREGPATQAQAETAMPMSSEHGFVEWLTFEQILRGWALAGQGQGEAGIAQMRAGLAIWEAMGNELYQAYQLMQLAEVYGTVGQAEEGLRVLAEARAGVPHREGRFFEAELSRLAGELLLTRSVEHSAQAETYFRQALAIARRQEAKSWELRAATSLARLWQQQGQRAEARELLAPIYDWFTEGFDTADLQEARALLDELA